MASTPIELGERDVTQSSQSLMDHRQSLLATPQKSSYPMDSTNEVHPHSGWVSRWHALPWKFEILSWITSLCFFIGIIVALVVFNGHSIPDLPLGINPNAIIQVLATFGEFFLMIPVTSAIGQMKWLRALQVRPVYEFRALDEASRGPWGSFVLILRRKGGLIASVGALITIITLGIGTFVQQTLNYDTIYLSTSNARVPIAKYMNGTGSAPDADGVASGSGIDIEVESATYIGLYSPPSSKFTTSAQCSSGNCTWESYRTLAICNTCADLTSSLKMTDVQLKVNNDSKLAYHTDYYSLPNGVLLNGRQPTSPKGPLTKSVLNITNTLMPSEIASDGIGTVISSIAFANNASALLSVFAIGLSPHKIPAEPDGTSTIVPLTGAEFSSPIAFECLLQLCVQEIRGEFRNGTLEETVISTYTNNTQFAPGLLNAYNLADTVLQPPDTGEIFVATALAVGGTANWLSDLFDGNATIQTNSDVMNLEDVTPSHPAMAPFIAAMNQSATGFPDLMDSIASSISRNLRTISYQPPPASGLSFYPTTRATIVWGWMALPFFLLVASLLFLIAVMVETEKKGLVPWTNNILAALFHGIDKRPTDHQVRETEHVMEEEARALLVEFQPREDGGRLAVA